MPSPTEHPEYSEPAYAKSVDRAKYPFYQLNIDKKLVPETRQLLEKYSHVPPEQQSQHVHRVRDQAWDIRAYPCTGDVGYKIFRDQDHFAAHFIEADILSASDAVLSALKGQVDITSVTQVVHQWDWDGQVKAAKSLATFTKPGSLIVGNQIGNPKAHEITLKSIGVPMWRHNPKSFKKLWDQVGAETGTKWETQAWMRTFEEMSWDAKDGAWMDDGVAIIEFAVRRI
ncbi:hypothetical protein MMC18_000808 [Xylographa bjoerkii]|nr:hypothetical protein [Xylographa bjoerkii]